MQANKIAANRSAVETPRQIQFLEQFATMWKRPHNNGQVT